MIAGRSESRGTSSNGFPFVPGTETTNLERTGSARTNRIRPDRDSPTPLLDRDATSLAPGQAPYRNPGATLLSQRQLINQGSLVPSAGGLGKAWLSAASGVVPWAGCEAV